MVLASSRTSESTPSLASTKTAHVIVLGNEKGGSGKTTTCMHIIVSLLRLGFSVGTIDIDARQRSLTRYIENRRQTMLRENITLPLPHHIVVQKSPFNIVDEAEQDERERFTKALSRVMSGNDFVIVDSPGNDTYLSRLAHSFANTVITPINDSFVDLDVLATVDGNTMKVIKPSIYSEMVWEQKLQRAKRDGGAIDWIVMRNRLSNIDARNKRNVMTVLDELSRRIGFRVAPGMGERVIFRELFLQGLTVLDIMEADMNINVSMSHVAARHEVRDLLKMLKLPQVDARIAEIKAKEAADKQESSSVTASSAAQKAESPTAAKAAVPGSTANVSTVGVAKEDVPSEASEDASSDAPQEAEKVPA